MTRATQLRSMIRDYLADVDNLADWTFDALYQRLTLHFTDGHTTTVGPRAIRAALDEQQPRLFTPADVTPTPDTDQTPQDLPHQGSHP